MKSFPNKSRPRSPRPINNNIAFNVYDDGRVNDFYNVRWDSCGNPHSPGVYIDIDACGVNSDGTIDDNAGYTILGNSGGRVTLRTLMVLVLYMSEL